MVEPAFAVRLRVFLPDVRTRLVGSRRFEDVRFQNDSCIKYKGATAVMLFGL